MSLFGNGRRITIWGLQTTVNHKQVWGTKEGECYFIEKKEVGKEGGYKQKSIGGEQAFKVVVASY